MVETNLKKSNQCKIISSLANQQGSNSFLELIKKMSILTLVIDGLLLIGYFAFLIYLFKAIEVPPTNDHLATGDIKQVYSFIGSHITIFGINRLITITILFLIVGCSTLAVNIKKQMGLQYYDYHKWESGNMLIKAITCLLYLNIVGLVMRLIISIFIMYYAEGYGYVTFLKKWHVNRKNKIIRNRELKLAQKNNPEQQALNKQIRLQIVGKIFKGILLYTFIILLAVFILIPFYWMILTALKTYEQSRSTSPDFFLAFKNMQWINFKFVYENLQFGVYIKNTIIVAIFSTIGTIITSVFAAFAFARIDFKGRNALFSLLLMTMMIPGEVYSLTNFITVSNNSRGFGWVGGDSATAVGYFAAMIVPFMTSVFYIFFLRQTFKQVPDSLYKSAKIDGCSDFKFLRRVMIPIARPTILTITILSVIGTWSAYVWPNLIASLNPVLGKNYWLIAVALRRESFVLESGADPLPMFNLQIAATAIVTIPLLIVFLLLRKYIIKGVGRSGTKG